MAKDVKAFHVLELENGETCIISTDKRQMARDRKSTRLNSSH